MAVRRKLENEVQTPSRITWTQLSSVVVGIRPHRTLLHQKIAQMYQIQNQKFSASHSSPPEDCTNVPDTEPEILSRSVNPHGCNNIKLRCILVRLLPTPYVLKQSKCTHRQVSESQSPGTTTAAREKKTESKVAKSWKERALKSIEFGTPVARKKQETRPQQQRKTLEKKRSIKIGKTKHLFSQQQTNLSNFSHCALGRRTPVTKCTPSGLTFPACLPKSVALTRFWTRSLLPARSKINKNKVSKREQNRSDRRVPQAAAMIHETSAKDGKAIQSMGKSERRRSSRWVRPDPPLRSRPFSRLLRSLEHLHRCSVCDSRQ